MFGIEMATYVATQRWFNQKRLLANGISTSGTGFGMLIMAPFVQWLISFYGLQGTFLILTGISLNGIVCGLLIPSQSPEDSVVRQKGDESSEVHVKVNLPANKDTKLSNEKSKLLKKDSNNGYLRLMLNINYVLYFLGSAANFSVMKAILGKC